MLQHGQLKVAFKCPSVFKENFEKANCLLTISVGQLSHEGEKLAATLYAVNQVFARCKILVGDTLQRHTDKILSDLPDAVLYANAKQKGDEWLHRNSKMIKQIAIPCDISRWDSWLYHPNFIEAKEKVERYYSADENFKKAMHATIKEVQARLVRRTLNNIVNLDSIFTNSYNYLIEECAAQLLWASDAESINYEIYPSPRNKILNYTYNQYVKPHNADTLKPISLKFKKRSSIVTNDENNERCIENF
jgi:hypothetical protein